MQYSEPLWAARPWIEPRYERDFLNPSTLAPRSNQPPVSGFFPGG